ncbi:DoxX family protein [Pseudorhodoplanes sp.]|uniref:DoxX family protein n=1 Tax=Pseudorhodoplanes sp. TaxID=1934341 RepID=UPI003D10DE3A
MHDAAPLIIPHLAGFYAIAGPLAEALLRVVVGLSLVPHGLRMAMGFFPNSGGPVSNVRDFAVLLDNGGYRPGKLWAWVIVATELLGGPMLALGLFTRPVAIPIVILLALSIWEHRRGFFWNQAGFEYPLLWTAAALYFLANGAGPYSLDAWIGKVF